MSPPGPPRGGPSEEAPVPAGLLVAEILEEAGFPAGVLNVVTHAPGEATGGVCDAAGATGTAWRRLLAPSAPNSVETLG